MPARSKRTSRVGAFKVDRDAIHKVAKDIASQFRPCPGWNDRDDLRENPQAPDIIVAPTNRTISDIVEGVRDPASGEVKSIPLEVIADDQPMRPGDPFVTGRHGYTLYDDGTTEQAVALYPAGEACLARVTWAKALASALTHELTHAADPYIRKNLHRGPRQKEAFCSYVNRPQELAAYLAQVRDEILSLGLPVRGKKPGSLLVNSQTYRRVEKCLTPKVKQRFLKMAAIVATKGSSK